MRYAPEHNEATRERILAGASRLFREHGIAAVGLARIMTGTDLAVGALPRSLDARHEELEPALREVVGSRGGDAHPSASRLHSGSTTAACRGCRAPPASRLK